MRRYPKKGGQFAIIWVDLLYEDAVPQSAKILFGEIYRLSGPDGWCDASNEDFMDLLGCSENTVRNLLRALVSIGQIRVQMFPKHDGKGGTVRRIFCGRKLALPEAEEVPPKNCGTTRYLEGVPPKICKNTYLKNNNKNNTPIVPREILDLVATYAGADTELRDSLAEFLVNRATPPKANPVKTAYGMKRLLNDLDRLSGGDRAVKMMIIDKSIKNNWRGFFKLDQADFPKPLQTNDGKRGREL